MHEELQTSSYILGHLVITNEIETIEKKISKNLDELKELLQRNTQENIEEI